MSLKLYNTLFIGKVLLQFPTLKSTNNYAINLLAKSKPTEGTVVITNNQVEGRGQFGSTWESKEGKNITLSVILYPAFLPLSKQFYLNMVVALAIYDTLSGLTEVQDLAIKWPNDIYINNNKVGGILIQNALSGKSIKSSVVGIGLNINQTEFSSVAANPTSLLLEKGSEYDVEEITEQLLKSLEVRYLQLKANRLDELRADYLSVLYRRNTSATYIRKDGTEFIGKILGVETAGRLRILNLNTNELEFFYFKEVQFKL